MRTYVLHVAWFVAMCAFVGLQWDRHGLKASVALTLLTVPPVLFYTVRVHALCRALDPRARTVGLVPVLLTTLVLSPFESGLVLPAKNLLAANRVLRACRERAAKRSPGAEDGPANPFGPEPIALRTDPSDGGKTDG
ncbi:MAG: hypothetical protein L0H23_12340 [Luteimonas sp.]|nr:hypothetical protein [Luteimonas sp.]